MIRTLEEVTVMADGLVTYAKDGHEAEDLTQIDLNILLRQICQDRGATFTSQGAASVSGRPVSLGRVFGNIIDNAVRHGKGAAVVLSSGPDAVIITVGDRGPGIPDERLDAMFQPFTRGENSRNADAGGAGDDPVAASGLTGAG